MNTCAASRRKNEVIRSRKNKLIKDLREFRRHRPLEQALLEGPHLIEAALQAGLRLDLLLMSESFRGTPAGAALTKMVDEVRICSDDVLAFAAQTNSPQGVLAVVSVPEYELPQALKGTPLLVVPCQLQDPGNMGTLIRTAAAAAATGVMLVGEGVDPWNDKALRASQGAVFQMPVLKSNLAEIEQGWGWPNMQVVALTTDAKTTIYDLDLRKPTAFLLGNEGAGLGQEFLAAASCLARIPMPGGTESLNAAVAGAIALFEAVRQRA
jgi:TrmH family RNA methyltransferase